MNEWFIQKWRVNDLRLNRLITYREGRKSLYFTSRNRDDPVLTCRDSLRVLLYIVGAEALYPMVGLCQRCSLGLRREGGIIGRKTPTFVDFRQADTENFGQGFQTVLRRKCSRAQDRHTLVQSLGPIATLELSPVYGFSWADLRESRKPLECFQFSRKADIYD